MKKKLLVMGSYLLVAAASVLLTLGVVTWRWGGSTKLVLLESLIQSYYIGEADTQALEDAAAAAMIEATGDRWSYYISASDYESYRESSENAYVGIGVTITLAEGGIEIQEVYAGSSALEAGLQPQDLITAIDGESTLEMSTTDARNLVRGKAGTFVELTILRQGQSLTLAVERRTVQVEVASGRLLEGNVGLVTIENFDDRSAKETLAAIDSLLEQGAEAFVFDVRNNPGGYVHELVEILDRLLPEGELFRSRDYAGKETVEVSDAVSLGLPMAVVVNVNSISAAEYFAAVLQEYQVATVVGEQTTGKGRYQVTFPLSDGSAVALSIGTYYTPQGVNMEGEGIIPDVEVSVEEEQFLEIYYGRVEPEDDPQIQAALAALKGK